MICILVILTPVWHSEPNPHTFEPVLENYPYLPALRSMHNSTHLNRVTLWFLSTPSHKTSSKGICQTNRALCPTTNNTPGAQLISCSWSIKDVSTCKWLCQHMLQWQCWFTALTQQIPILWTHLSLPLQDVNRCLQTFPQSEAGIKMASLSTSFSDYISKIWK